MTKYVDKDGLNRFFDNIKDLSRGPSYQQVKNYLDSNPESLDQPVSDYFDDHPTATIANNSVTTAKIADGAITADKFANNAVNGLPIMSTTQVGVAKVGAGLAMNNGAIELNADTTGISGAVEAWLDAHPEATTTVEDGAISTAKLADGAVTDAKLAQTGGILEDVTALWETVYGTEEVQVNFTRGAYTATGYTGTATSNYARMGIVPAGKYTFTPPAGYRFNAFYYISDAEGVSAFAYQNASYTFEATDDFVLNIAKDPSGSISDDEITYVSSTFSIVEHVSEGFQDLQNKVTTLESSLVGMEQLFRFDVLDADLVIGRLTEGPSSSTTGLRTQIVRIYEPTRINVTDKTLLVRVNRYSTAATFTNTYIETLRDYAPNCDFIVSASQYPIYIAVGIRKPDLSTMSETDLATISSEYSMKTATYVPFADISMFKTFGVAGDSWTAGTIYNEADTQNVSRTGQGWGENLARQSGVECINFAAGGTSVRTWYNLNTGDGGLKQLLESDAVGLYILSMGGSNDWTSSANGGRGWELNPSEGESEDPDLYYFGTIADISDYIDYNDYPLTFYGYYGRIIEQIQEHAPNSRIIITTPNTYPTSAEKCVFCYAATQEIADYYGIPYMDLRKDTFFTQ